MTEAKGAVNDELEKVVPQSEPKKIVINDGQNEAVYIQQKISFFNKLELFSYIGDAIDKATSGEDGISVNEILGGGVTIQNANQLEFDNWVRGLAKLAQYVPDIVQKVFCIALNVPKHDRPWAITVMSQPAENGGLSDDEALEILATFVDQNGKDLKDFFSEKVRKLATQVQKTFGQGDKGSSKRSKATQRTTQKQ